MINLGESCFTKFSFQILIIHPGFLKYIHDKWTRHHGKYPSTGLITLMFAIHTCTRVSAPKNPPLISINRMFSIHGLWPHTGPQPIANLATQAVGHWMSMQSSNRALQAFSHCLCRTIPFPHWPPSPFVCRSRKIGDHCCKWVLS